MKSILISGCFHSMNSGVMAMVETLVQKFPDKEIFVLSSEKYWDQDKERYSIYKNVTLAMTPWRTGGRISKLIHFGLGLLGMCVHKELNQVMSKIDTMIDISGDTISSDYKTLGIIFTALPFLIAKRRKKNVIIAPQTLGPFHGSTQISFAKKIFGSASKVFIREEESKKYLNHFKTEFLLAADVAFMLEKRTLEITDKIGDKTIAFGVSDLLVKRYGMDYSVYFNIVKKLLAKGYKVLLVTHVELPDADDVEVGRIIKKEFQDNDDVIFFDKNFRSSEWKGLLEKCKGIISGRMHPIVMSLSMGVPALNISYNHKSIGVVKNRFYPYGQLVDSKKGTPEQILDRIEEFVNFIEGDEFSTTEFEKLVDRNRELSESFIASVKSNNE